MHRTALAATLLLAWLLPAAAQAWNHTGHRLSGFVAYRQLDPQVRRKVDAILRDHPRYQQDLLAGMPAGHSDPAAWAFMTAATWPDMLRSPAHPMGQRHHRPEWHYVNIPFVQPGDDPSDLRIVPAGPLELLPGADPQNVVQALYAAAATLQSPRTSPADRAIALCWYLHLAGDVHQPLHAATRFSLQFPEGDRGGNSIVFTFGDGPINLHAYWDNLLGSFDQPGVLIFLADLLRTGHSHDSLRPLAGNLSYRDWARQSFAVGVREVYLNGQLQGGTRPPSPRAATRPATAATGPANHASAPASDPIATTTRPGTRSSPTTLATDAAATAPRAAARPLAESAAVPPPLPPGYDDAARRTGGRQVALAGHRIAADLNQLLRAPATTAPTASR